MAAVALINVLYIVHSYIFMQPTLTPIFPFMQGTHFESCIPLNSMHLSEALRRDVAWLRNL